MMIETMKWETKTEKKWNKTNWFSRQLLEWNNNNANYSWTLLRLLLLLLPLLRFAQRLVCCFVLFCKSWVGPKRKENKTVCTLQSEISTQMHRLVCVIWTCNFLYLAIQLSNEPFRYKPIQRFSHCNSPMNQFCIAKIINAAEKTHFFTKKRKTTNITYKMYPCELLDRRDDTCVPYTNKLSSFGCSVQHAHRRTHFDVRMPLMNACMQHTQPLPTQNHLVLLLSTLVCCRHS